MTRYCLRNNLLSEIHLLSDQSLTINSHWMTYIHRIERFFWGLSRFSFRAVVIFFVYVWWRHNSCAQLFAIQLLRRYADAFLLSPGQKCNIKVIVLGTFHAGYLAIDASLIQLNLNSFGSLQHHVDITAFYIWRTVTSYHESRSGGKGRGRVISHI